MRTTVSLALALSLIVVGAPVAAQEHTPTTGPIARALRHEAAHASAKPPQSQPGDSQWSRVRSLASGSELIVTVGATPPARRYFVAGDEFVLTVLNVAESTLPAAARDALRNIASAHPEYFAAAEKGGQFVLPRDVRMGPDGVFVSNRKVAALDEVVQRYPRSDITEIRVTRGGGNPVECAFAGYFLGAVVGGLPGALVGGTVIGDTGGALGGMATGWAIGGVAMYRKCKHRSDTVIYRAP